eukprot:SAG31_NODE_37884_length_300_cov_1.203980_1_plen_60_part_10
MRACLSFVHVPFYISFSCQLSLRTSSVRVESSSTPKSDTWVGMANFLSALAQLSTQLVAA